MDCPECGGQGGFLGLLGRKAHFRCRQCGIDFNHEMSDENMEDYKREQKEEELEVEAAQAGGTVHVAKLKDDLRSRIIRLAKMVKKVREKMQVEPYEIKEYPGTDTEAVMMEKDMPVDL